MLRPGRRALIVVLNIAQVLLALAWFGVHTEAAQATSQPAWSWPLQGDSVVERTFAPPKTRWGVGHRGVDLLGEIGQPVVAAGDGDVTYAGKLAGKDVIAITHANGLRTTYEPVRATVRLGAHVAQGQRIGELTTGHSSCRADTTCLHWGLLRGDTYLDPLSLITQGRLRLLPTGPTSGSEYAEPPAFQAAAGHVATPELAVSSKALAEPRRRGLTIFINLAANVTGAAVLGYGLFLLVRKGLRVGRARR